MKSYWLSWYWPAELGEFELHSPWWISGQRGSDNAECVCAAVRAESDEDAWDKIYASYDNLPEHLDERFCEEQPDNWTPFNGRFPQAEWMKW